MKNVLILLIVVLYTTYANAQWNTSTNGIYYNGGKVGIGITNPSYPIHIRYDDGLSSGLHYLANFTRFDSGTGNSGFSLRYESDGEVATRTIIYFPGSIGTTFQIYNGGVYDALHINDDGNIGLGIINPSKKLHLATNDGNNRRIHFSNLDNSTNASFGMIYSSGNPKLVFELNGIEKVRIDEQGKVGIGTTSTGSHKLAVEGSIGAREIKIEASGWSDFVFENDYELRTLEEVEHHINENGHLPEIPSEAEVTENGINLGEMNAKLLQKIEELTLYLIEQNKQNQAQQEQLEAQSEIIEQLKKEVSALKSDKRS